MQIVESAEMTAHKQNLPSFASVVSVLSIVLYCAGFLRVELELNEQKTRINALENVATTKPPSNDPNVVKLVKDAHGKFVVVLTLDSLIDAGIQGRSVGF